MLIGGALSPAWIGELYVFVFGGRTKSLTGMMCRLLCSFSLRRVRWDQSGGYFPLSTGRRFDKERLRRSKSWKRKARESIPRPPPAGKRSSIYFLERACGCSPESEGRYCLIDDFWTKRLPCTWSRDDIIVLDVVRVRVPYTTENVVSNVAKEDVDDQTVLRRVKLILEKEGFTPT